MRKIVLTSIISAIITLNLAAQDSFNDNGYNLKALCPPEKCKYIAWKEPTYFPFKEDKEWQINNMEIAIKSGGSIIMTGDMTVHGEEMAAIAQLEFVFVDDNDEDITSFKTEVFEFFNEPGNAEPIVFTGQIEEEVSKKVAYVLVEIREAKRVPYYEISSSCFLACKNIKLKDAMKAFKKGK